VCTGLLGVYGDPLGPEGAAEDSPGKVASPTQSWKGAQE
jgi:hypothetical protein